MTSVMSQPKPSKAQEALNARGGMKSVLLHIQDDEGLEARLQSALAIVRAASGHLSCLQVTPTNVFGGVDVVGAG